jgi:hypothetical protein
MASWLLSPTHLHVKWRKKEKRGGSRTFLFFSPAECRNAENERRSIAGPIQGAHLPVMAPAAITKREARKK